MSGMLSVQLYSVRDALAADRPGTLARLAQIGYRYVEPFALGFWNTPTKQLLANAHGLRADLDAAGLAMSSVHAAIPAGSQDAVAEVCRILETDTVIVAIPLLVEGLDGEVFGNREELESFAGRMNEVAHQLADHGIRLGYHNHHFEWAELGGGDLGFDVLWELLDPIVVAEFDVYWAVSAGQDPVEILARLGARVVALHLKDGPGGLDDPMQPKPQVPIGAGVVDVLATVGSAPDGCWHITEIDITDADPFELLATNRRTLINAGHTIP
ncbi:sugar phosphate isomerase/epimerase [Nocardia vinacea]|uniref:sugar phosphate isomerase/epimerase family protein n=1 Tax=Nocardia vinacea TaxID=96468 RepID=UPI0034475598